MERMPRQKKKLGRPTEYQMPEPIADTPENVARAQFRKGQPKKAEDWEFMQEQRRKQEAAQQAAPDADKD